MHFARLAQIGCVAFAAVGVYGFVATARDGETRRACSALCSLGPSYADDNRLAPDFELPRLGGGKLRLSSLRGKTVILNFWTKTCRPCLEEMPSIAQLAKSLREHPNIQLLTICTDETLEDARDTLRSVLGGDPPFEVLLDPDSEVVSDKYGTKLYPETWFIDPRGVIRARFDGARDWASPLPIELGHALGSPIACEASFRAGKPDSTAVAVCSLTGDY